LSWEHIERNWYWFIIYARMQWDKLSVDELCRIAGDRSELIGRIQQQYAISRADAERQVQEWAQSLRQYG